MLSSRTGGPNRTGRRAIWAGITACGLLSMVGCQVEYAGMTLPTGHYLFDDVQYFAPGPDFPLANTQAATQRARMQALGIDPATVPSGAAGTMEGPEVGLPRLPFGGQVAPGPAPPPDPGF